VPPKHIKSLDSVRGFAALTVMVQHSLIVFPAFLAVLLLQPTHGTWMWIFTHTPLHIVWDGHEAVILFFVLSGFVLSLPYYDEGPNAYGTFLIRRFFRIYFPYLVAVTGSMVILTLHPHLDSATTTQVSSWFRSMWDGTVNGTMITNLVFMSGKFNQMVDTSTWSLVYEMRISLFFPILPLFLRRTPWYTHLGLSLFLLSMGVLLMPFLPMELGGTVYYTAFFVIGASFAKYRHAILRTLTPLSSRTKGALLLCALALYNWTWLVPNFGHLPILQDLDSIAPVGDFFIAVAALVWIAFALVPGRIQQGLERPTARWLGTISYSLYLIHPLVLLSLVYGLSAYLPLPVCVLLVPPVSVLAASLFHFAVESPSNWVGRRMALWLGKARDSTPVLATECAANLSLSFPAKPLILPSDGTVPLPNPSAISQGGLSLKLASLTVIHTVRDQVVRTRLALRTRLLATRAASDNVTQGTWIIVAVALAALVVGALAQPKSPVHHWLHCTIRSISTITSNASDASGCTTAPATLPPVAINDGYDEPFYTPDYGFSTLSGALGTTTYDGQSAYTLTNEPPITTGMLPEISGYVYPPGTFYPVASYASGPLYQATVTFDAKSSTALTYTIGLTMPHETDQTVAIGTQWQAYTVTFQEAAPSTFSPTYFYPNETADLADAIDFVIEANQTTVGTLDITTPQIVDQPVG